MPNEILLLQCNYIADTTGNCIVLRYERQDTFIDGNLEAVGVECDSVQNNKVLCKAKGGKICKYYTLLLLPIVKNLFQNVSEMLAHLLHNQWYLLYPGKNKHYFFSRHHTGHSHQT